MALQYSCFLSYQRGNDLVDRFARELFSALSDELGTLTELPVWFDTARLASDDYWSERVVRALSSSVCMVPILTPTYFSLERPYCSREFLGMEMIESSRQQGTDRHDRLIFPVVLRGSDRLPSDVLKNELYDFSDYLAFGPTQFRSRGFAESVARLAKRIGALCDSYRELEASSQLPDIKLDALPSEQEARVWLKDKGLLHASGARE